MAAEKGTPQAAAEQHEFLTSRESLRLAAISQGQNRANTRTRAGLNSGDVPRAAELLNQGRTWQEVKVAFRDVKEDVLEAWKPEIERYAREGPQTRRFAGQKGG